MFKIGDKVKLKYNYQMLNVTSLCSYCTDYPSIDVFVINKISNNLLGFDIPESHELYNEHKGCHSEAKLFELALSIDEVIELANKLMKEVKSKGA